jgi:hypothetical protein
MICRACVDVGHCWRKRKLDPAMTVHLLLLQLLASVALISLDQVAQVGVSAVAICRARMRLPLSVWMKLAELIGLACAGDDDTQGYCGHKTYRVDGTTFTAPDTPELAGKYGRGKGSRKRLERLGRQDLRVQWNKPPQHKLSWLSKFSWRKLPASLQLRQIAFCLHRKGFGSQWVWIITTLDCPVKCTAVSLAELYGKRWDIEVAFRHLKGTLKMNKLSAKTVDGVKKQILAFVMLYNLVRHLMNQAARKQGVAPDRISFSDALTALLYLNPDEPMPRLRVNPKRHRPAEPRARKHGGYRYPVLKQSRAELQRPHARVMIGASKAKVNGIGLKPADRQGVNDRSPAQRSAGKSPIVSGTTSQTILTQS